MKIAIIQPRISYFVGGSEKVSIRHIEYLYKLFGVDIDVFTIKPIDNKYSKLYRGLVDSYGESIIFNEIEIPKKYKYIYDQIPGDNQTRWDNESLLFSNIIYQTLSRKKYDLILNYYFVDILFKPLGIPNVVYLGGFPKQDIPIYNSFLHFCHATLSNSKNVYKHWKTKFKKEGIKNNFIIKKGVDELDLDSLANPFNLADFNIVFVGRLIKRKGVDVLLRAFRRFSLYKVNVKIWIIGDGPEYDNLIKISKSIGNKVQFVGTVQDVYSYLYFSDLCVFPSIKGEGLMTTLCEAMMCGKCVIATRDNGNEEVIKNRSNGFLVKPGNVKQLAEILDFLYKNKNVVKIVSKRAKIFASKNFGWNSVIKDLYLKLEKIVDDFKKDPDMI